MPTWTVIGMHLGIFAVIAVAVYGAVVLRNAVLLFLIPRLRRVLTRVAEPKSTLAEHPLPAVKMSGRTQPCTDFVKVLQSSGNTLKTPA